jgi:hypothetical protein
MAWSGWSDRHCRATQAKGGGTCGVLSDDVVTARAGSALLDALRSQEGSQSVGGIGDRAVYLPSAGLLVVSSGGDAVPAQTVKSGVPSNLADATTVLVDVLDRR